MSLRDVLSGQAGPLDDILYEKVSDRLRHIEDSVDEARYEVEIYTQDFQIYVDMFCERWGLSNSEFNDICGLDRDEPDKVDEGAVNFLILTKLQRGIGAVARRWENNQEEELAEIPPDLLDAPLPTTPQERERLMEALEALEKPRSTPLKHGLRNNPPPHLEAATPKPPPNLAATSERWVYTGTDEVSLALAKVATELTRLRRAIKQSNEIGSEDSPLSPIHRAMLLAMLQAMLIELTQPYVEQGRVKSFFKGVTDLLKKGAKDAVSKEVADALGAAADAGKDLMTSIMTSPGIENLSDLPPGTWSV